MKFLKTLFWCGMFVPVFLIVGGIIELGLGYQIPDNVESILEYGFVLSMIATYAVIISCLWQVCDEKTGSSKLGYCILVLVPYLGAYIWLYKTKSNSE